MLFTAWWSLYVDLGGHSQRRLRARPLRAMETLLGHRLWVGSGVSRYPRQPENVYHFDAYSCVEAIDAEHALNGLRERISRITPLIEPGALDPDDEYFIAALYWTPRADFADGKFHSSGVQLRHACVDRAWRHGRRNNSVDATLAHLGAEYVMTT